MLTYLTEWDRELLSRTVRIFQIFLMSLFLKFIEVEDEMSVKMLKTKIFWMN